MRRYFVASASHDLLRYLTRDSDWIAKICTGLQQQSTPGPATQSLSVGEQEEERLTDSVIKSLNAASRDSQYSRIVQVRDGKLYRGDSVASAKWMLSMHLIDATARTHGGRRGRKQSGSSPCVFGRAVFENVGCPC